MNRFDGTYRVASEGVERVIEVRDGLPVTRSVGAIGAEPRRVDGPEIGLVLDAATWRHDIPTWRWLQTSEPPEGWQQPGFHDGAWRVVPHLHPVITARVDGAALFRAWVTIPAEHAGQPVTIVLGGLDDQDWARYAVWLDGRPLDAWKGGGRIREPRRILIEPGSPAASALRFGEPMLLAVRAEELVRDRPDIVPGEAQHHFFADWLLDQAVVVGSVDRVVDGFQVTGLRHEPDTLLELELRSPDGSVGAMVRHVADGPVLRRTVRVTNLGGDAVTLLDAIVERWRDAAGATDGGRGQPTLVGPLFVGVEHPAGVTRVDGDRVELWQMPGRTLEPGASLELRPSVVGGAVGMAADAAFRAYVLGLRPRPSERIKVYSALGWYDFTNPADPLPELTEELVAENLGHLAEVAAQGARFDVYMLDDWWDWTDLGRFRPSAFPSGHVPTRDRIEAAGLRVGLWWATTRAVWSVRDRAGMDAAAANAPEAGAPLDLAGGEWRWLEEFTNLMIGERRFCLAAEPYREHALASLPAMVGETRAGLLKLDCAVLHCTSSEHGHRAGRYAMDAMADAVEALVAAARERSSDLRVVLYWGFRSPWWLGIADAMFDKGLLMEAATVASAPGRTVRHSLTTNVDQAIRHARLVPRRLQDSLGVWVGDVAWCNRIGRDEWLEAFLADLARGADLVQLWGDLTLLDDADRAALGAVLGWFDADLRVAAEPVLVGGDPWLGEAYGYRGVGRGGEVLTLVNPGAFGVDVAVEGGAAIGSWVERYPVPGAGVAGGQVGLRPFETRVLVTGPTAAVSPGRPVGRPSRRLAVGEGRLVLRGTGDTVRWTGSVAVGDVGRQDEVQIAARLHSGGAWSYVPEPGAIVRVTAMLDGLAVRSDRIPRTRDRNGPGSPWTLLRVPAGPAWSGRALEVVVEGEGPEGMEVLLDATLVHAWWLEGRRRFG